MIKCEEEEKRHSKHNYSAISERFVHSLGGMAGPLRNFGQYKGPLSMGPSHLTKFNLCVKSNLLFTHCEVIVDV